MTSLMRRLVALLPAAILLAVATAPASAQSPSPTEEPSRAPSASSCSSRRRGTVPIARRWTCACGPRTRETRLWNVSRSASRCSAVLISRTAYEESPLADPVPAVVVTADSVRSPGGARARREPCVRDRVRGRRPGDRPDLLGVYPLKVDLRSDGVPVAEIRTPVVYPVREPEPPWR